MPTNTRGSTYYDWPPRRPSGDLGSSFRKPCCNSHQSNQIHNCQLVLVFGIHLSGQGAIATGASGCQYGCPCGPGCFGCRDIRGNALWLSEDPCVQDNHMEVVFRDAILELNYLFALCIHGRDNQRRFFLLFSTHFPVLQTPSP